MKKKILIWIIPALIASYLGFMLFLYVKGNDGRYVNNNRDWMKYNYTVVKKAKPHFASVPSKDDKVVHVTIKLTPKNNQSVKNESSALVTKTSVNKAKMFTKSALNKRTVKKSNSKEKTEDLIIVKSGNGLVSNESDKSVGMIEKPMQLLDVVEKQNISLLTSDFKSSEIKNATHPDFISTELLSTTKNNNTNSAEQKPNQLSLIESDPSNQIVSTGILSMDEYKSSNQVLTSMLAANTSGGPMRATGVGTQDDFNSGTGAVDNTGKYNDSSGSGGNILGSLPIPDGHLLMMLFGVLYGLVKFNLLKYREK